MALVPTISVRFALAQLALELPARALLIAPKGSGGTATVDTPTKLTTAQQAADFFGASSGQEAAERWFTLGLQSNFELWGFAVDATGWTANTWEITASGTATAAGTNVLRLGDTVINVDIAKSATAAAAATAMAAAITAADTPFGAVVNGGVPEQVDITSDYVGAHAQRFHVSVDLYNDRGELGVDGLTWSAVTNNADSTGNPTTLTTTNLTAQPYLWYLNFSTTTSWLDSIETWLEDRWENANNYAHGITAVNDTQANTAGVGTPRNDEHMHFLGASDAPEFELQSAIASLRAVEDERADQDGITIRGVNTTLKMNAPTVTLDATTLLTAGITPIYPVGTQAKAVRMVSNRRKDDASATDLRFFALSAMLRTRTLGDRLTALLTPHLGDNLVSDDSALSPNIARNSTSLAKLESEVRALLKQAAKDAIIDATQETAAAVLTGITTITEGGIKTGFSINLNPTLVQGITELKALATLR